MTPRERWLALLAGRSADRIPADYQATAETTARLLRELGCPDEEALWARLGIDGRRAAEPRWKLPHHPDDPLADAWGVRYERIDYGAGAYEEAVWHPLARAESPADLARHRWPDPEDYDYSPVAEAVERSDGLHPILAGCYEPFLLYGKLRGLELAFEDLALRPALVEAILGRILDFYEEHHRRIFEAGRGRIDLTWVAEDLGSQTGPLMSLETYRRFLLPGQIRMAELARRYGVHVLYHTDGAARIFLPDLVDRVGIELLDPVQWRSSGMDREGLVRDFGRQIVFHGSIDNQRTLAFGTPEDVAAEVREAARIFSGARWICGPCHNIQPITPMENVVALYETVRALGAGGGAA
ncbi:MAG: uroporphyrinogen decarboxylase family protein [Planctomycetota bacterium]